MRRWFLSYNSQDFALAQKVEAALRHKDPDGTVFFAPKSLRAGSYWLPALAEEIAAATVVVLLVGEKGIGRWQVDEYYEARDKRVPVVLVLLEGQPAPGLPFLRTLHWIVTPAPTSDACLTRLMDAAAGEGAVPGELWRHTAPYRGLAAMKVEDSDYFFGRGREMVEIIKMLAGAPDKLPVLLGNSGVGKSSLAQAGVLAALARQAWSETAPEAGPWPQAFAKSRQWCFLTLRPGEAPVTALVEVFMEAWQFDAGDPARIRQRNEWVNLLLHDDRKTNLAELLGETERRQRELTQAVPPGFFLYVDQGEELYVRAEPRQRRRFSEILALGLGDPRLRAFMSLRSDFLGALQADEPLFGVHRQINVVPLREAQLCEIVERPAEALSAGFETDHLAADIARRTSEESARDAGALPLLSYTLDDMWGAMVKRGDGVLRLPAAALELGGVLAERANRFLSDRPQSEDALRRLLTLKLATVREDGEPTRRRAPRSEFSDQEWRLVYELADHPNRLLITATPEGGETYAEVAHEAIFRRWEKLKEWIAAEREFLAWRTGLEADRRSWQATPDSSKNDALLMGAALTQAQSWLAKRRDDLSGVDRDFIGQGIQRERKVRARARRVQALVYLLLVGIILGLIGVVNQAYLKEEWNWYATMRPYRIANFDPHVLKPEAERALKPLESFRECKKDCPIMVVVPAGEYDMGSPTTETGREASEGPQHKVVFAEPFAVSKYEVTFDDWDACVNVGWCPQVSDNRLGRRDKPVINVNWDEAQLYVAWLSKMTGKTYRLLTEAEWEYAARAGTETAYYWGEEIGEANANCYNCGSRWDTGGKKETAPVGSFKANKFGLHNMAGNVWEWVQDCWHDNYNGAPTDGSKAWTSGDCDFRVARGGSWGNYPPLLRSAYRYAQLPDSRHHTYGLRVARTLTLNTRLPKR